MFTQPTLGDLEAMDQQSLEQIQKTWWVFLVGGIISVVFGLFMLTFDWDIDAVAVFFGIFLLFWGLFRFIAAFSFRDVERVLLLVVGLIAVGMGILILVRPEEGLEFLAAVIGWWLVIAGVMDLVMPFVRKVEPRWVYFVRGGIALVLGIWALGHPEAALWVLILVFGIMAIIYGVVEIVAAFQLKDVTKKVDEARAKAHDELDKLQALHAKGVLTDDEYARQRARVTG